MKVCCFRGYGAVELARDQKQGNALSKPDIKSPAEFATRPLDDRERVYS